MLGETVIAALTLGVVQVVKPLIKKSDLHPLLALVVGTIIGLIAWPINSDPMFILTGVVAGLAASGAYKTIKDTAKSIRSDG